MHSSFLFSYITNLMTTKPHSFFSMYRCKHTCRLMTTKPHRGGATINRSVKRFNEFRRWKYILKKLYPPPPKHTRTHIHSHTHAHAHTLNFMQLFGTSSKDHSQSCSFLSGIMQSQWTGILDMKSHWTVFLYRKSYLTGLL